MTTQAAVLTLAACLAVSAEAAPDFTVSCSPGAHTTVAGAMRTATCTVQSLDGFNSPVALSCTSVPGFCSFNPTPVTPPPNFATSSSLALVVSTTAAPGTYNFQVVGQSGALTRSQPMNLTVVPGQVIPFALAVDAAGNRVLEPNETVVVAPTWRNVRQTSLMLGGTTSGFTGPAGATYTNPDATGSYGVIPGLGTVPCVDCYSVNISAAARPAAHWDSTIRETVSPPNPAHTWTLHVGGSFDDVPATSPFYRLVEALLHWNVTGGCSATQYCPGSPTTREQMAAFVLVAKSGASYLPPPCVAGSEQFADVPASSPFCRWIEELARRGAVGGCGGGNYCPSAPVSREQMAVFVLRTQSPTWVPSPCTPPNLYADVPETSPFCRWIEDLSGAGIVSGCGGGNYCPTAAVTREQMGVFIGLTFGLTLYGP